MLGVPTQNETATGARWILPSALEPGVQETASAVGVPVWFASLLRDRGVMDAEAVRRYLHPSMADLHDPWLMSGMRRAVERILQAVAAAEPILIYGDYDVDGTVATVLLKTAIDRVTPKRLPSLVRYHIPHRIREGYGMRGAVLGAAAEEGVRLVISVDTGIRAFAAADEARAQGLDLIVTDHHLPDGAGLPDAYAVIHPNQEGCAYPFKELCGAGVAFKLAQALLIAVAERDGTATAERDATAMTGLRSVSRDAITAKLLPSFLKLLAIATVADAVPLHGENRTIVSLGLQALRQPRQHGLRALMELAKVPVGGDGEGATATDIAFRIAPRINAAGRMDLADDVVRLLLTADPAEGQALAAKLHQLNEERRAVEAAVLAEAQQAIHNLRKDGDGAMAHCCLVLDGDGWHRGVVGIVASRVLEATNLPALVVARDGAEAHGSGRSISGFHLLDALTAVHIDAGEDLFLRFGGHAHAVGFSLASDRVAELRHRLHAYSSERISEAMVERTLKIDADLPMASLTTEAARLVRSLEPFGQGNREPVFYSGNAEICETPRLLKNAHLKLKLRDSEGAGSVACLCWSRGVAWPERMEAMQIREGSKVDVAYRLHENKHPEFGGPEMELCDIRLSHAGVDSAGKS